MKKMNKPRTIEMGVLPRSINSALMLAAIVFTPLTAGSVELATVLETSRVSPPARVIFREERHNPLFEEPLLLDGYLEYLGPGVLSKVIESPFQEAFLIEAGEILMQRDGETRRLPVKRSKALETILGAIEAILAGEAERLETVFNYEITGSESDWSVELTPRSRRISKHLACLRVSGGGEGVSRILIDLRDGEYHVMNMLHKASPP